MKTPLLLVPLLAALTASLWFYSPAQKSGAQGRRQGARKAEPRVALVVGNRAYAEGPLANPVNKWRIWAMA